MRFLPSATIRTAFPTTTIIVQLTDQHSHIYLTRSTSDNDMNMIIEYNLYDGSSGGSDCAVRRIRWGIGDRASVDKEQK